MKKYLTLAAVLPLTASALPLVELPQTGTKLELTGSLRVNISGAIRQTATADGNHESRRQSPAFTNDSTRFGFRLTQPLGQGFYTVGNVEWRFRGTSGSRHNFDDIYTRQLNAGFGHQQYGELLYGNILSIADKIRRTDLANDLTLSYPLLPALQRRILQYTYSSENWEWGIFYGGASPRNGLGLDLTDRRKNLWGSGVIYTRPLGDNQLKFSTGMIREQFRNHTDQSPYRITTYALGTAYHIHATTLAVDVEQRRTHGQTFADNRRMEQDLRFLALQQLNPQWRIYAQYGRRRNQLQSTQAENTRTLTHRYLAGVDYFIMPDYVKLFTEFRLDRQKSYRNGEFQQKTKERTLALGLRIYW